MGQLFLEWVGPMGGAPDEPGLGTTKYTRKIRLRGRPQAQGPTAAKQRIWDSNPGLPTPEFTLVSPSLPRTEAALSSSLALPQLAVGTSCQVGKYVQSATERRQHKALSGSALALPLLRGPPDHPQRPSLGWKPLRAGPRPEPALGPQHPSAQG